MPCPWKQLLGVCDKGGMTPSQCPRCENGASPPDKLIGDILKASNETMRKRITEGRAANGLKAIGPSA